MSTNGMTANGTRKLQPLKLPPLNLSSLNKMLLRPKSPRPKSSKSSRPRTPRPRTPRTPSPRSPPVNANPRLYTENLSLDPPTYIPNVVVQEIPLIELERRVRICEEILYSMNHAAVTAISAAHENPETNYLNNLVYIPYIPEFSYPSETWGPRFSYPSETWGPASRIAYLKIHPNGTTAFTYNIFNPKNSLNINITPNETNFLNKFPMEVTFHERRTLTLEEQRREQRRRLDHLEKAHKAGEYIPEPPPHPPRHIYEYQTLNVEIIRRETISKALFETRLQIHEYEKVPRNVLGARINYSQMPYTVSP